MSTFQIVKILVLIVYVCCLYVDGSINFGQCQMSLTCGDDDAQVMSTQRQPGVQGNRGAIGQKGQKGSMGNVGLKGAKGEIDANGDTGPKSEIGLKGEIGQKGVEGQSCTCVNVDELQEKIENLNKIQRDMLAGNWLTIQHRLVGSVDFYRNWDEYVRGFGGIDYWMGLEAMHRLTTANAMQLRVELVDRNGIRKYAYYDTFKVASTADDYRLTISGYTGNAGDSMAHNNNMKFSTSDRDNDDYASLHCSKHYHSGWWFGWGNGVCTNVNINGNHLVQSGADAMYWLGMNRNGVGLRETKMLIRPK